MKNSSIYDVFERMWQHVLIKFNNYASTEVLNNHVEDRNNPHNVTKDQIGLVNVDNTADLDKPISNAAQAVLDGKADKEHTHEIGEINGIQDSFDEKADLEHIHDVNDITSGILDIEYGGTGYNSIVDTEYNTPRYRASVLVPEETYPYDNGVINWMYE